MAGGAAGNRMSDWRNRMQDRPQTDQGRRDNLQDRLSNRGDRQDNRGDRQDNRQDNRGDRQDNRQDNRGDRQDNRQDNRNDRREDWQDHFNDRYPHYGDWYAGHWHGHWGAGWWDHMWSEHPVAAAMGLTWWGVNRACWWSGYLAYSNPYASGVPATVYDYSEPFVEYVPVPAEGGGGGAPPPQTSEELPPGVTKEGMTAFDQAREAFYGGNYAQALEQINAAIKQMPNDAVCHEFRALTLFALGNYKESAAALYAVLSAGPGWDWKTMCSLYASPAEYEKQLRALEAWVKANPKAPEGHFVAGYHYLTCGHPEQAAEEWREVKAITKDDRLIANLLAMVEPGQATDAPPAGAAPQPAKDPVKTIPAADVAGTWTASGAQGARFTMTLTADGKFTWTYTRGSHREEVKGVFAIEQNVLALEPHNAAAMLSEITLGPDGKMKFNMIGAPKGDPGLEFVRQKS